MKKTFILQLIMITSVLLSSCSKFETSDLIDTFWTGTCTSSEYLDGEHNDISFDFENGKANFTILYYGEQYPESGVMLYSISNDILTISKANEMLNGEWKILFRKGKDMTLERTVEEEILTLKLQQRK